VLLRIDAGDGSVELFLCDGSRSAEVACLLHGIAFGEEHVRGRSHTLQGRRGAGDAVPAPEPIKPLGVEQSNTSFVFESRLVGKLVRRVEPGVSLEVEVLQALEKGARRPNVPRLEAHIEVEAGQSTSTLWVSESFVPNEGDAWQLTVDHAQRFYEDALTGRHGDAPTPAPTWFERPNTLLELEFAPLARLLGRRTAELHGALFEVSSGDTAPKAFNALSSRAFYQSVRNLSARAFDALRLAALPERGVRLAREVVSRKADLRRILDKALSPPLSGLRMRVPLSISPTARCSGATTGMSAKKPCKQSRMPL
jgi:maltose alpha-D-glucosyltransferase/alpha-amylase